MKGLGHLVEEKIEDLKITTMEILKWRVYFLKPTRMQT